MSLHVSAIRRKALTCINKYEKTMNEFDIPFDIFNVNLFLFMFIGINV